MEKLKICFAASEVAPFAKTGGLADVASALPAHLHRQGHDVRLFMPLYSSISLDKYPMVPVDFMRDVPVRLGSHGFTFSVYVSQLPGSDLDVYFIHCRQLFDRPGVYTGEWDEHLRFALLSHAVFECCQRMGWPPDIIHCNDWHTALIPIYLKTLYSWDRLFANTKTILTIHNLAYQGIFPAEVVPNLGLSDYSSLLYQDDFRQGHVGFLKTGLLYADIISTVSRTYAREIQTPEFGHGLDPLLRERRDAVVGIVNGVDYELWNPETDSNIHRLYNAETVAEGKAANQRHLLGELGLKAQPGIPVLGIVSRLTAQKGFDLLFEPMPQLLRYLDVRFVVLGSGEHKYESFFTSLQQTFPQKVCYYRGYNDKLAHMIEAGADIFIMPSLFEPCGLNQMYSLKYGTVPIVRKTGGLADTVELFNPDTLEGTGFVFDHFTVDGMTWALKLALTTFKDPSAWERLRANGMSKDYSWNRQGALYEKLYRQVRGF